jgi:hypothetical protein
MKFIEYLIETIESTKDYNFIMNKYYIYNKLISFNELKDFLENSDFFQLLKYSDFKFLESYRSNRLKNELNKIKGIKSSEPNYIFLLSGDPTNNINTRVIINYELESGLFKKEAHKDINNLKGIVILKQKFSKKNNIKNYNSLEDLSKNEDVALYVKTTDHKTRIICYNMYDYNKFFDTKSYSSFIVPILFNGEISNRDRVIANPPSESGSIIEATSARADVKGRDTLYPILGYYANNNILMSDRDSVSPFARSVWNDFFKGQDLFFKKHKPIDDYKKPITDYKGDDGRLYTYDNQVINFNYDPEIIKNLTPEQQQQKLTTIRSNDPYNWTYKLKNKSQIEIHVNKMIKQHEENFKKHGKDFINQLEKLSENYDLKRIL